MDSILTRKRESTKRFRNFLEAMMHLRVIDVCDFVEIAAQLPFSFDEYIYDEGPPSWWDEYDIRGAKLDNKRKTSLFKDIYAKKKKRIKNDRPEPQSDGPTDEV